MAFKSQRRDAHLLHQHVDVQLGVIQHVAVGPVQALQGPLHRLAVNVDPAGSARGQELPVCGGRGTALCESRLRMRALQLARLTPDTHWYTVSTRVGTWACPPWRSSSHASQKLRFSAGSPSTRSGPPELLLGLAET